MARERENAGSGLPSPDLHNEHARPLIQIVPRSVASPQTMASFVLAEKKLATVSPILSQPLDYETATNIERAAAVTAWQVTYSAPGIARSMERLTASDDFKTLVMVNEPQHVDEYLLNRRLRGKHTWNKLEGKQLKARFLWNKIADLEDYYRQQVDIEKLESMQGDMAEANKNEASLLRREISSLRNRLHDMGVEPLADREIFERVMIPMVNSSLPR